MTTRFFRGILQDRKTERNAEVLDNSAVMVKAREAEKEGPHVICNRGTRAYPCHGVNWGSEEEAQRTSILHMFISQSFYLVLAGITALGSIQLESVPNRELVPEI